MDPSRLAILTGTLLLAAVSAPCAPKITVVARGELAPPAQYGLARLQAALQARGLLADSLADTVVLVGTASTPEIATALRQAGSRLPVGPESIAIARGRFQGRPALILAGGDARGVMYAALDTADRVAWSTGPDPFQYVRGTVEKPYLAQRGVSMYTMQRAYFESKLYDEQYWIRYFDLLAASRINSFVVIFGYENGGFMAPLYPYFFNVNGLPDVELVGITPAQQARNTAAFQAMIRLAHERGIEVTAGIWDHIYRGGVQGGGIPGASENAGKRVPGLVWGVTADNLAAYTRVALRQFLETFPEIDAIQFRMHDESGLKHEEMGPFWHDVFTSIQKSHPKLKLDLRAKELPDAVIEDALNLGLDAKISTKYWMEQMGLPFHPTHVNVQNQKDRRHGYADLLKYPQRYRVHWQVWSGGTARVLQWGDPEFVRRFAAAARLYNGNSFEVNEMLATKMLGEPHDEKPLDILNPGLKYYQYEFERYWHFYQVWGRYTYNPAAPRELWERPFQARFGPEAGPHVAKALHRASQILPRIVAASYRYQNFPTTRGWAEMNRQGSLPQYAGEDGSDIQQFMNVRDQAKSILEGTGTAMRRPEETSRWFAQTADAIRAEVDLAERVIGSRRGNEFRSTVADLKILEGLARYHSWRLLAGVSYNLYTQAGSLACFDDALAFERRAVDAWGKMVAASEGVYSANLAFGPHAVGFSRNWGEEYRLLKADFEKLEAERQAAAEKPGAVHRTVRPAENGPPPIVQILPVAGAAQAGQDLVVSARVSAPVGVKWVRLRYRHVTQFEDYATVEMTLSPKTGIYSGRIPGGFIQPQWDLMYFVEAVDGKGFGRMYPDLEREAPYLVLPVKR